VSPAAQPPRPKLIVLAGVNGAGKSSVGGALLSKYDIDWYNPDEHTRLLVGQGHDLETANATAWTYGTDLLRSAIRNQSDFAFETTLGGHTVAGLIAEATKTHDVSLWFCGLATVDMHIARVAQRVSRGGHDISEAKIRARWDSARENLITLMPLLAELRVMDNSRTGPAGSVVPKPQTVLWIQAGRVREPNVKDPRALAATPAWAGPIVEAALKR
jgi:predicted ABC-type ATPase